MPSKSHDPKDSDDKYSKYDNSKDKDEHTGGDTKDKGYISIEGSNNKSKRMYSISFKRT